MEVPAAMNKYPKYLVQWPPAYPRGYILRDPVGEFSMHYVLNATYTMFFPTQTHL